MSLCYSGGEIRLFYFTCLMSYFSPNFSTKYDMSDHLKKVIAHISSFSQSVYNNGELSARTRKGKKKKTFKATLRNIVLYFHDTETYSCMLLAKYLFYISCFLALLYSENEDDDYPMVTGALCIRPDLSCCTKTVIRYSDRVYLRKKVIRAGTISATVV